MNLRNLVRSYFTPLTIIGSLGFGIILFGVLLGIIWVTRPAISPHVPPTAILTVIPAPTSTNPLLLSPTPEEATPTSSVPPAPPPGDITVGAYVQVSGTGGDGLRVRADPGLQTDVLFIAVEAEIFLVKDGPRQADDYTWWYLVGPYDETHHGWAVSNYLAVTQNP